MMRIRTLQPSQDLGRYIRFYWLLDPDPSEPFYRLLPGTNCDIIIQTGPPASYRLTNEEWKPRNPSGFVEGMFTDHFLIRFTGPCRLVGIRFRSTGLYPFVKTPVREFTQQFIDLEAVFGRAGYELIENLHEVKSPDSIRHLLNRFFSCFLSMEEQVPGVQYAVNSLIRRHGMTPIRTVRAEIGCPERRFERLFERHVGVSPERFAQILKVNHFINLVRRSPVDSFTRLSFECGFADQSHLIRSFRKHTGLSPTEYFSQTHPIHQALNTEQQSPD